MKKKLSGIVADLIADYADIRYEENRKTRVTFQGKKLEQIASYLTSGGHVRAYASGGRAIASFSDPDNVVDIAQSTAASAIARAYSHRFLSRVAAARSKKRLAEREARPGCALQRGDSCRGQRGYDHG